METFEELAEKYPKICWHGAEKTSRFVFDYRQVKIDELKEELELAITLIQSIQEDFPEVKELLTSASNKLKNEVQV